MIILHPFSLMQEIQHHENCLRPAIQGYSAIFFFAIHCCSEYFRLLMRYPFWISNSTEAENCTKKQTNEQINLLLENSKFLQLQSCKIFVSKLCIRSKNTIMVIINDVFSPNCICTYQEKKSYLYALQF